MDELTRTRAELAWHEARNGTRADQEAEDLQEAADLAASLAMTDEEIDAQLREAGVDPEEGWPATRALIRVCGERNEARQLLADQQRAFVETARVVQEESEALRARFAELEAAARRVSEAWGDVVSVDGLEIDEVELEHAAAHEDLARLLAPTRQATT